MRGHVRKRGARWCTVLYIGRTAAGTKRFQWKTHASQAEAHRYLARTIAQEAVGSAPARLLVGAYLTQWIRDAVRGFAEPYTAASYSMVVERHLVPALGRIPLTKLGPAAIQAYLGAARRAGLSATTLRYHYRVLHAALAQAVLWGLLGVNPAKKVPAPKKGRCELRVWDDEPLRRFLEEARRSSTFYPLYLTAAFTGLRQGELLGLRWEDVDPVAAVLIIRRSLYRLYGIQATRANVAPGIGWKMPKSGKSRPVPLPPVVVRVLEGVRTAQRAMKLQLGDEYRDHGLVFCQPDGRPLHPQNLLRRDFLPLIRRAQVPRIRFHDLRHGYASLLIKSGAPAIVVQACLGHASAGFTMDTYGHLLPGMQRGPSDRMAVAVLGEAAG